MEVIRSNFQTVLTELDEVLSNATFLAIDGEFTGLTSGLDAKPFDTPSQYYEKLSSGSMDFLLIQFGLSVFTYDEKMKKYKHQSYNFYVFPRGNNRSAPDCRFMCQTSSIMFLSNQGFDFNKLFSSGIPYLTSSDEEKMIKRLDDKRRIRDDGLEIIPVSDDDKPQIDEICSKINEFLRSEADELLIDRCNAYIRRLMFQEVRIRWPDKVKLESKIDGVLQGLVAYKLGSKDEEDKKETYRREKENIAIKEAVGLTALLRKIADSQKLIVGHNMLLDLCHIVRQFFGPLPENYSEFKALIHNLFPKLIDTKIIAQSSMLKDYIPSSVLSHVFETLSKKPFTMPDVIPIKNRSYDSAAYHEAGYDAFVTGMSFIAMTNFLSKNQMKEQHTGSSQFDIETILPVSSVLSPFLNKLLIVRFKDPQYINLSGNDPSPNRDHVFHITLPQNQKTSNISQLFHQYGGAYISWISDTTAYVSLNRREQISVLKTQLKKNNQIGNCWIQSYKDHQASLVSTENNNQYTDRKRKQPPTENSLEDRKETKIEEKEGEEGWELATGPYKFQFMRSRTSKIIKIFRIELSTNNRVCRPFGCC
ncbi:poly(A)-specific ribonuclease PARN-like isoform X1 [Aphidius gifuensis]|uniref:poly(A)-specific ribonuclease PARN-like isoform X1 n=1 Tax=Aphidius gifuensis TaxID=684658 RepID=UPI001CDD0CD5|nr:poly(A)-specific ribonuclease PARN-like isoform X1 [Aphidius gifuensis]